MGVQRLFITGFDSGDPFVDFGSSSALPSGLSYETTITRGQKSLKINPASGSAASTVTLSGTVYNGWRRFYLRVTARPASTARVLMGDVAALHLKLNPTGTLSLYSGASVRGTSSTALTDTTRWYLVEVLFGTTGAGGASQTNVMRIDEVNQFTLSGTSGTSVTSEIIGCNDTVADTYTAYIDDYIVTDNLNAPPGAGKVAWLPVTSDNSVGSGWQKPGGATTNLYTSIDNAPPVGVADSTNVAQAENQIRNASTSNNYVANADYSSAGIFSWDTIKGWKPYISTGAAASSKTGSLVLSNPTVAASSFSTYYSGVAAGTFPTGWKTTRTTGTYYNEGGNNFAVWSEDFSNAFWAMQGATGITVTSNTDLGNDGTTTADTLNFTASNGAYRNQDIWFPGGNISGRTFTFSIWAKAGTKTGVCLRLCAATVGGGDQAINNVTLTSTLTRYSVTRTFTTSSSLIGLGIENRGAVGATDTGTGTIVVWGAQVEEVATPSAYTATTNEPRYGTAQSADPSSPATMTVTIDAGTNSQVALVSALGMHVDYLPGTAPAGRSPRLLSLASSPLALTRASRW